MSKIKLFFYFVVLVVFASCGGDKSKKTPDAFEQKTDSVLMVKSHNPNIEVYNFYGKNRCKTCIAIGTNSKLALQENFKKEMVKGSVKFIEVNIDDEKNKKLAEKFEATGSSLYVMSIVDGEEFIENLTDFAFMTAAENPEVFKKGIVANINDKFKK